MNMKKYPCMGCEDRKIACHDKCYRYKNFCYEKDKIKISKRNNSIADEVKFNSIFRSCDLRDKKNVKGV